MLFRASGAESLVKREHRSYVWLVNYLIRDLDPGETGKLLL